MALTIIEMNYIQQGIVRPLESTLFDLVTTMAIRHARYLVTNFKDVEGESELAISFVTKMSSLVQRVFNKDNTSINRLQSDFIQIMGNSKDFVDIRGYSIAQWIADVENLMELTFQSSAGVTTAEINAYNAVQ